MPVLPKHKPGQSSKVKNLNEYPVDPLRGNYTLYKENNIIATYNGGPEKGTYCYMDVYTANIPRPGEVNLNQPTSKKLAAENFESAHLATCAADFLQNGKDQVLTAYVKKTGNQDQIHLELLETNDTATTISEVASYIISDAGITDDTNFKMVAGHFTTSEAPQFVMVWAKYTSIIVKVGHYDTAAKAISILTSQEYTINISQDIKSFLNHLVLSAGYLFSEEEGGKKSQIKVLPFEQIVITYPKSFDNGVASSELKILGFDGNALFEYTTDTPLSFTGIVRSTCTGAFNANMLVDCLAVATEEKPGAGLLSILNFTKKTGNIFEWKKSQKSFPLQNEAYALVKLAAGDLNGDSQEELLLATQHYNSNAKNAYYGLTLQLAYVNNDNTAIAITDPNHYKGTPKFNYTQYDFDIKIGALYKDAINQIIFCGVGHKLDQSSGNIDGQQVYQLVTAIVNVNPGSQQGLGQGFPQGNNVVSPGNIESVSTTTLEAENGHHIPPVAVTLADTTGTSIRVGEPKEFQFESVQTILGIFNAFPVQEGFNTDTDLTKMGGIPVGQRCKVTYKEAVSTETSLEVTASNTHTTSMGLDAKLSFPKGAGSIGASFKQTYGEGFSKSTTNNHTYGYTIQSDTLEHDLYVYESRKYTVWEYPTYNEKGLQGYVYVIFPSKEVETNHSFDATGSSFYLPNHIQGNILSYPSSDDIDTSKINYLTEALSNYQVTEKAHHLYTLSWKNSSDDSRTSSISKEITKGISASLNIPLKGFTLGLSGEFSTTDTIENANTHKVKLSKEQEIDIEIQGGSDAQYTYKVKPLIYFADFGIESDTPTGPVFLDYIVEPDSAVHGYDYKAGQTKAQFSLPYSGSSASPDMRLNLIGTEDGYQIDISVMVRNPTLSALSNAVNVHIFDGDPEHGGKEIAGSPQKIASIKARGKSDWLNFIYDLPDSSKFPTKEITFYARIGEKVSTGQKASATFTPIEWAATEYIKNA